MKNSHITIIAVLVGSTFLLATTGCDADNSSDSMHDEEQSEALGKDAEMPGVAMPGVVLPSAATPDTQQPAGTRKVTIEATNFAFNPATISAQPDEKLYIELVNKSEAVHMWQIENLPGTHVQAPAGETSRKVVQAPSEPGSYRIVCMTPGHEERGMVGWLKVRKNADTE